MPIPHQTAQFFFGVTNQDASKRGVNLADLVLARDAQQLHPGEHIKRGGFNQTTQVYDAPTSIAGESITSPDGLQVLIRDSATDTVFARSTDTTHNIAKGASKRIMTKWPVRFPAIQSGQQLGPMAKQAGDYYVWLKDESHFMIARRSTTSETELTIVGPIQATADGVISKVKSFAVVDVAAFDATSLWIFWVDWSTDSGTQHNRDAIRSLKVSHDLATTTFNTLAPGIASNRCATSICASVTADNYVTVGITIAHRMDGSDATFFDFRSDATRVDVGLSIFKYDASPSLKSSSEVFRTASVGGWTASGICSLTAAGVHAHHTGHCWFSFWAAKQSDIAAAELVVVDVTEATGAQTWKVVDTVTNADHHNDISGSPGRPYFLGSTTGHETTYGAQVAAQMRIYYHGAVAGTWMDPLLDYGLYPDRLWTRGYDYDVRGEPAGVSILWTARAAWLASGYFTLADGTELLITGWQDNDGAQMPYHLRRFDTGAIICQLARGEAAFPGGCGSAGQQIAAHISDINQPATSDPSLPSFSQVLVALTSANVTQSTDIANVTVDANGIFSPPVGWRSFAIAPGPVPTITSGWQRLCEAGPLSDPSGVRAYWGSGSS